MAESEYDRTHLTLFNSPQLVQRPNNVNDVRRLLRGVTGHRNGCWVWRGAVNGAGYGIIRVGETVQYIHRLMYALCHGAAPEGKVIHHTCHVITCINPAHLEAIDHAENVAESNGSRAGTEPHEDSH
jgi:hypothetical protein